MTLSRCSPHSHSQAGVLVIAGRVFLLSLIKSPSLPITTHTTVEKDHGRIETRTSVVSTEMGWLQEQHQWPGLAALGKITRTRETGATTSTETAYYLLSTP